jgi:hypothetical protein
VPQVSAFPTPNGDFVSNAIPSPTPLSITFSTQLPSSSPLTDGLGTSEWQGGRSLLRFKRWLVKLLAKVLGLDLDPDSENL